MAAPGPPNDGQRWMPNGFPPRTFPVDPRLPSSGAGAGGIGHAGTASVPAGVKGGRRGKGWWVVGAAVLLAVLLLGVGLALSQGGDDGNARVAPGTSTSTAATGGTRSDPTTSAVTPSSIEPVGATTAPNDLAAGAIEASPSELTIPRVDANAGPQAARLTLRNTGVAALSYTTQASSKGLTASPGRGTIGPGAATELSVTLDGSKVTSEGPFRATLEVGGTGGTATVQVSSVVGRPPRILDDAGESCTKATATCSKQIKLSASSLPNPSPCNTLWFYSVRITDASPIQAFSRQGQGDADPPLVAAGQPPGASGIYQSREQFKPLPKGAVLRFAIEAVDQHGFAARLPEQTIQC